MTSLAKTTIQVEFYIIGIILAAARIGGEKSEAFQAVSHLFMGALIVKAIYDKSWGLGTLATVMSVIEVLCFIYL